MIKTHTARFAVPSLFLVAGLLTIATIGRISTVSPFSHALLSTGQYIALAVFAFIFVLALLKRARSRMLWEVLFTLAIFFGVWYVFLILGFSVGISVLIAAVLTILHLFIQIPLYHNAFFLVGGIGAAIVFAGWFPPEVLLLILVAFTVYDMVLGPPGGPIVHLTKRLVSLGFVPGFVFPERLRGYVSGMDEERRRSWVLLGTGDVVLPLVLVAHAASWGFWEGVVVMLGMMLGSLSIIARFDLHPRAVLPALAAGTAVPFLALLFSRGM